MRVAIYIRVSTKMQEDRYSLAAQREELTRYSEQQGWKIIGYYKDVDSGGKLDKKGLNMLLDDVDDGKIDVVLCIDQDRLSRLDTVAWEYLKSTLRDNGVKIAEPGIIVDLENEDDEFISDIKNLIARREKKAIVRRMMRGKRQRVREGKGYGKTPFEYLYDKATETYSINEKWSWIIPFIDDLYLNQKYSFDKIAKELNRMGMTPNGNQWSSSMIKIRFNSKAYHGILEKKFSNGEVIQVPDVYPKLRTEDTYLRIQEARKKRYHKPPSKTHFHFLRNVKISCAICGRKITVHQCGGGPKYGTHFYLKHSRIEIYSTGGECRISINTIRIEENLAKAINGILSSEEIANLYLKTNHGQDDLEQLEQELKSLNTSIQDASQQLDRLLGLYLAGTWDEKKLDEHKTKIENQIHIHKERKSVIENKREMILSNSWNYDMIKQYLAFAQDYQRLLTAEEQMEMIGRLFPKGVLYEDKLILTGELPGGIPLPLEIPIAENPFNT